jgi:hypothetical protein
LKSTAARLLQSQMMALVVAAASAFANFAFYVFIFFHALAGRQQHIRRAPVLRYAMGWIVCIIWPPQSKFLTLNHRGICASCMHVLIIITDFSLTIITDFSLTIITDFSLTIITDFSLIPPQVAFRASAKKFYIVDKIIALNTTDSEQLQSILSHARAAYHCCMARSSSDMTSMTSSSFTPIVGCHQIELRRCVLSLHPSPQFIETLNPQSSVK